MPDPTDILKIIASGGVSKISKETETKKETPTPVFTRRSYVAPKPPKPPRPSETGKKGTLKPESKDYIPSTGSKKRKDLGRIEETVEKANNDQSVIENYNNSDSGFNPYKDFGGG